MKGKTIPEISSQFHYRSFIITVLCLQFYHCSLILMVLFISIKKINLLKNNKNDDIFGTSWHSSTSCFASRTTFNFYSTLYCIIIFTYLTNICVAQNSGNQAFPEMPGIPGNMFQILGKSTTPRYQLKN